MGQERNMSDLRRLISIKTGKDAAPDLGVLGEIFYARRPAWNVLENVDIDWGHETYKLPCSPGYYIRFTIDCPDAVTPDDNFFQLDPPLDIHTDHVRYSHVQVLAPADLL